MAFFSKLKERLFKSSSKLEEGLGDSHLGPGGGERGRREQQQERRGKEESHAAGQPGMPMTGCLDRSAGSAVAAVGW